MKVLIIIFHYWPSSLSLSSILCLISWRCHTPLINIDILHFNGLYKLYKVINILDYKNLTLTLYIKGKDSIVNKLILVLEAYRERKNPMRYLRPHFINPKSLLNIMAKVNVYILGSRVVDYFVPSSAKPHFNFNIYI